MSKLRSNENSVLINKDVSLLFILSTYIFNLPNIINNTQCNQGNN